MSMLFSNSPLICDNYLPPASKEEFALVPRGWAFFRDNMSINVVQTCDENLHSISTHEGLFQCNGQDHIHTYDVATRQEKRTCLLHYTGYGS